MEQKAWIRKQSGMTTAGQTESCCMERGLEKSEIEIREKNDVTYLAFPALDATGLVSHAFSTRHGGVTPLRRSSGTAGCWRSRRRRSTASARTR